MLAEFLPILILIAVAAIVCTVMVVGSWVLGPKKFASFKEAPYECGVEPFGTARERFPIKFYLTAILFVLFDIEVVFLWSWLSVFKGASTDFQVFSGIAVGIYMVLWIIGDWYAISVGAIEWDEGTSLAPEKLVPGGAASAKPASVEAVVAGGAN